MKVEPRKQKLPPSDANALEKRFCEGNSADDDFQLFLETRPAKVSVSMLKSQKAQAQRQEQERQNLIHADVAVQREAVTDAQWKFFQAGLKRDHSEMNKLHQVPAAVKAKIHQKVVMARKQQAEAGQKATQGYQARTFEFGSRNW